MSYVLVCGSSVTLAILSFFMKLLDDMFKGFGHPGWAF